jgi:hypothetical protein
MVIEHINRRGDTYYLHEGRTKTGKPKYFFSRNRAGTLADSVPNGFEVYESPNAQDEDLARHLRERGVLD